VEVNMAATTIQDSIEVEGTPQACVDVITDFDAYPSWQKNTRAIEVIERDDQGRGTRVQFVFKTPVKIVTYDVAYDWSRLPDRVECNLIEGDISDWYESFTFTAGDGSTTLDYEVRVHPGFPLPDMIRRQLQKQWAHQTLRHIKKTVEAN
jgi:hypothetical protein